MGTALIYVLMLLAVAALFFLLAALVFGRGEQLAPIPPGASPTWLPEQDVAAADVRALRFQQAVRGYRMSEVDWVLDRLAGELGRAGDELDQLRRRVSELESAGAEQTEQTELTGHEAEQQTDRHTEERTEA